MTKAELVDQVADRADLTKQDAARAVDAVLATVEDALRRGSEVAVSGFGKFHVSERGARHGGQPAHGRADPDRRLARAPLHGGQRPEERGEGPLNRAASFGDTLAARVAERESQIVLGLDPDPGALWPQSPPHERTHLPAPRTPPSAPQRRCSPTAAPDRRDGDACVAVKPQLARFELLGAPGWAALDAVVEHARARGLLVIADGKRGDIDVSAAAYAAALLGGVETPFGRLAGLGADLVTVNPLMGGDALEPFVTAARASGAGVLVLVRTSNPGAADVEDLALEGGGTVWERIAVIVDRLGAAGVGESGLSDVGAVVGATEPRHLARARELMPCAPFLLPGVGAQGGRVEDLAAAFAPGRAGGLVTASRSVAGAHLISGGEPAAAARAEAERLRDGGLGAVERGACRGPLALARRSTVPFGPEGW